MSPSGTLRGMRGRGTVRGNVTLDLETQMKEMDMLRAGDLSEREREVMMLGHTWDMCLVFEVPPAKTIARFVTRAAAVL